MRWNLGMQSRNGAWGAFDVDNTSPFPNRLPFCDFGEVIDPPSADVTAHVVEMLAAEGMAHDPRTRRGIDWLLAEQEAGRLLVRPLGRQLRLRHRVGGPRPGRRRAARPRTRRSAGPSRWLESVQNDDGGWGEDLRSYRDARVDRPRRLHRLADRVGAAGAAGGGGAGRARPSSAAIGWLAETQREDGSWDEPYFTGTGFPWDFSINYHLYRQVFPLTALGRYVHGEPFADRRRARQGR